MSFQNPIQPPHPSTTSGNAGEEEDDDDPIDFLSPKSGTVDRTDAKSHSLTRPPSSRLNPIKDYSLKDIEPVTDSSPDLDLLLDQFNRLDLSKPSPKKLKPYPRRWPSALTPAQQLLLQEQLQLMNDDTINKKKTYEIPGASCGMKELKILTSSNRWLNDEIINFYGALINNRDKTSFSKSERFENSHQIGSKTFCFSTFFMTKFDVGSYNAVQRWTKKVNLLEKDLILFPINLSNSHWTLGVINNQRKRFEYYDSLGAHNLEIYSKLRRYYKSECLSKKNLDIDLNEWSDYKPENVPRQTNSYDCDLDNDHKLFDFSAQHMAYLRQKVAFEVITQKFIPDEVYLD